jgi:Putative peptidoglycan binding domain
VLRRASINTDVLLLFLFLATLLLPPFAHADIPAPLFSQNHQLWDTGSDIQSIQQFLNAQGFIIAQSGLGSPGHETTIFCTHTYHALVNFQSTHRLPTSGFFGPSTRATVIALIKSGTAAQSTNRALTNTGKVNSNNLGTASTTSTTSRQYIPGVTPLPGYLPSQVIFGGGSSGGARSAPVAPTCSISASPATINIGSVTLLTWSSSNASGASLTSIGTVSTAGSQTVFPSSNTTYTLTVTSSSGSTGTCNATVTVSSPNSNSNDTSPLGVNLAAVRNYSSEQPFLNILKTGFDGGEPSGWITKTGSNSDTGEEAFLALDANGWVTSLTWTGGAGQIFDRVWILLFNNLPAPFYPSGGYVVLYDGTGTLTYGNDAAVTSTSHGRDTFNVSTSSAQGVTVTITATDPNHTGDYIRNIRVVQASNEAALDSGQIFNPTFLARIAPFKTLRFMDWMVTNGNLTQGVWANRPQQTDAFWGSDKKGVPLEVMTALANQIHADAWFNMPAEGTDDYVTKFATYVHSNLGSSQKVYLEYSNEFWNGTLGGSVYMQAQGHLLWPTQPVDFNLTANYYGVRISQMCDIWKGAWGADAGRVVCVMGQQTGN